MKGVKAQDKLRVTWGRGEREVLFHFPLGAGTRSDAHYLSSMVFTKEVTDELEARGYDLKTLRFEISPAAGNERFASQRPEPGGGRP